MTSEKRVCQSCHQEFTIEPEDFAFHEKIKVPPPTWCPECRLKRRLSFRNERSLSKRKCDLCGEEVISAYDPDSPLKVYCQKCWWSDQWDPFAYGREYDFSRPFFGQFKELQMAVPRLGLVNTNSVNSEYTNYAGNNKSCYLIFSNATGNNENCAYGTSVSGSRESYDLFNVYNSELLYDGADCQRCYRVSHANYCFDCREGDFLEDCRNCEYCIGCKGLRNKKYHIFNEPYSKEEYEKKREELRIGTRDGARKIAEEFEQLRLHSPNKFAHILNAEECSGDYVTNSKRALVCFDTNNTEDSRFLKYSVKNVKGCEDVCYITESELGYETLSLVGSFNCHFCNTVWWNVRDLEYSELCFNSENLFGCISLKKNQYCILNKQYSKEEYEELVPRIIEQMKTTPYVDTLGRTYGYGEYFPIELSPFGYNETIAHDYFPLERKMAEEHGYRWRELKAKSYSATLRHEDIPDSAEEFGDSILKEVIGCAHEGTCNEQCTGVFKIIPQELQFYKRMHIPLPTLCPNCRHYERLKQRNPLKLWHRSCMCGSTGSPQATPNHGHAGKCPNEFETSYAPDRPEIVYCENCYQSEVV